MKALFLVLAALVFAQAASASAPTATLAWVPVTADSNGNPLTGVTYNIYQAAQGSPLVLVQSGVTTAAGTVTAGLTPGTTQCFAVTAVANKVEGAQSNTACAAIPFPTPGTPTQITVVVH